MVRRHLQNGADALRKTTNVMARKTKRVVTARGSDFTRVFPGFSWASLLRSSFSNPHCVGGVLTRSVDNSAPPPLPQNLVPPRVRHLIALVPLSPPITPSHMPVTIPILTSRTLLYVGRPWSLPRCTASTGSLNSGERFDTAAE